MLPSIRRRLAAERGMTIIEMIVALGILAVVLTAAGSFFLTMLASVQQAERRTRATALANEELENLRTLPWNQVGFYENDDFGGPIPPDAVKLGSVRPAGSRAPLPVDPDVSRGISYSVTRTIEWFDDERTANTTNPDLDDKDYKQLAVEVSWEGRLVRVESTRAPTPSEQPSSDFVLSHMGIDPEIVPINADGTLAGSAFTLSALTAAPADFVEVTYPRRDESMVDPLHLASVDGVSWTKDVNAGQGHTYANGDVIVTFIARRLSPYAQQVIGQRIVRFLQPVEAGPITFVPGTAEPIELCAGDPAPAIQARVHFKGLVAEDDVTLSWGSGSEEQRVPAVHDVATVEGSWFTATIPAASYDGTLPFTATGERLSVDPHETSSSSGTVSITVQECGTS